jgi:hypothetical protein
VSAWPASCCGAAGTVVQALRSSKAIRETAVTTYQCIFNFIFSSGLN